MYIIKAIINHRRPSLSVKADEDSITLERADEAIEFGTVDLFPEELLELVELAKMLKWKGFDG